MHFDERLNLSLGKQSFEQPFTADFKMRSDIGENGRECADAKRGVLGDREMMLASFVGREPNVATGLAGN